MRFPSQSLRPRGGEIYCHVFENDAVGLKRNLFWAIRVDFADVRYGASEWPCSTTCEWIVWPVRTWKDLDGLTRDLDYGEGGVECSFYMTRHHPAGHTRLSLKREKNNLFRVVMDMTVRFGGFLGGDKDPALPVHADVVVPFTRLIVVPANLSPAPDTAEAAKSAAAEFVDLVDFLEPDAGDGDFSFRPKC
jgi:hypothetical protein